jgi:hypothetical protein
LLIRNTLDVIHCEKNLYENVIKTIFGAKDIPTIQKDMEQCGIQPHLWLQANGVGFIKPNTSYVLIDEEK